MREIKFRVWDSYKKAYLDYPCRFNHLDFNDFFCCDRYFKCDEEKCIVQQFTGLLDKNGEEIYEGDIIQYNSWTTGSYGSKFTGEVRFGGETAGFAIFNKEDGTEQILWRDEQDYLTVIGNIFENPELCAK
jgi:uncharacterized phage protein (TIGR01671 family)